jgi:hypothetical protein
MSTGQESRLARIEGSIAIQQLPARYAMAVDSRDLDALAALYVDDIDLGSGGTGRAALKTYFAAATSAFYRSVHQIVGHTFDFEDDDHASGRVYCRAEHERGETWIVALMCYFDRYERRGGQWYFGAKREFDFFYCADLLERPQQANFRHWVVPGMKLDPPMMHPRFPSWERFWSAQGPEAVARVTAHPARTDKS